MARTLDFSIEGSPGVNVLVEESDFDGDGSIESKFTATVDESEGNTADLRALFGDVANASAFDDRQVAIKDVSSNITDSQFEEGSVVDLGHGANIRGKITRGGNGFDAGVEFGTPGASPDDIQSTSFIISGKDEDSDLTVLDHIGGERVGARLTSVGEIDGDREDSLKLEAIAPHAPDAVDDEFTRDEDTIITGNVLSNDTDEDGDTLEVVGDAFNVSGGIEELTLNADGSFELEPETSHTRAVNFDYKITDNNGGTDWATANVNVERVEGITEDLGEVPLDIVLSFDLSGSFADDLPNIQSPSGFFDTLDNAIDPDDSGDVKFGVTNYIDYPFDTFGSASDHIYKVDEDLTSNDTAVQAALDGMSTGSGFDSPEAQLVALQQVGLGNGLNYTAGSERFVVLSTDAPFHKAGDFVDGGTNDNDTDLTDGSGPGGVEDYPSIVQVADALDKNGVTPIFAVTASQIGTYENLLDDLDLEGAVVELQSDSSDLASTIEAGLFQDLDGTDGRDTLSGNSLRNTINGFDRADEINGEGGDDTLIGGNGDDTLTGGEGADTFVFQDDPFFRGTDTVTDFEDGIDMLQLEGFSGGIGFGDLAISDDGSGNAEIAVGDGEDDPIAILQGIATADLGTDDFAFA